MGSVCKTSNSSSYSSVSCTTYQLAVIPSFLRAPLSSGFIFVRMAQTPETYVFDTCWFIRGDMIKETSEQWEEEGASENQGIPSADVPSQWVCSSTQKSLEPLVLWGSQYVFITTVYSTLGSSSLSGIGDGGWVTCSWKSQSSNQELAFLRTRCHPEAALIEQESSLFPACEN